MEEHAGEYFQAVKIRDTTAEKGKELKRHFITDKRGEKNSVALEYTQRIHAIGNGEGGIMGIFIEWEEVPMAYDCGQTMIQVQTLANYTIHRTT